VRHMQEVDPLQRAFDAPAETPAAWKEGGGRTESSRGDQQDLVVLQEGAIGTLITGRV
jgi:hypothetical protein